MTRVVNIAQSGGNNVTMRNRIINGAMMIDQRNAGASVTPANGAYTLDRYRVAATQASKFTIQQNAGSVTPPAGFRNYLGVTSSSAYSVVSSDFFLVGQPIEGFNTSDLGFGAAGASTVTLSFWVRSSLTGTFGGSLNNSAYDRCYPFNFTINSANTWEQKFVTITGDTTGTWVGATNGIGMYVWFNLGSGSTYSGTANTWAGASYLAPTGATSVVGTNGATFYITGVQLEAGTTATPFEQRLYGTELALCQRYYAATSCAGGASADNDYSVNALGGEFPTKMRSTPTIVATGSSFVGHHGIFPSAVFYVDTDSVGFEWSGSGYRDIGSRAYVTYTASAEL